jgi:purine nucleosidase
MRRFVIDTDTASDDAVGLIMALREPSIKVEAITVVAGNCPIETCVKNALVSVERANTYSPPVYKGVGEPILRRQFTSEFVHGSDGMGEMELPEPNLKAESGHAVDAIIELADRYKGDLEIIALGPLTNLAIALIKEPRLAQQVKHLYVMGGAGLGPGNITPVAEFNFFVDAEAAEVVIRSKMRKSIVGWDVCMGKTFIDRNDISHLNSLGELGRFAVRCNHSLIAFNTKWGNDGFDLPDPTTVAAALYPDFVTKAFDSACYVEYRSEQAYGQFVIDRHSLLQIAANATIVAEIDAAKFKAKLFHLLAE